MKENKFSAIPDDFTFFDSKVSISKSELSKAIGNPEFVFTSQKYDKKVEDKVVTESSIWIKKIQEELEKELKQMYGD